ncbi:MAG TPA: exo-alpha-sialidase [Gemmataceae bacterium]|nr:exo-alpha-sialidase [Gemmataceae bacterium]
MKKTAFMLALCCLAAGAGTVRAEPVARPNIVYILADDLGYGDVKCFNPEGKIPTPHMDKLAADGMIFTDAHSGSSVCTPTRYGILTGRYSWRSRLQSGVLGGYSPRLIEEGRLTVPALLKQHGYHTACIGKWHLGMDWPLKDGGIARDYPDGWKVDYTRPIQNGPNAVGFDYYFGISASLDMPPYIFIENDRTQGVPTVEKTWIRKGPAHADFEAINVLPTLTKKAVAYLDERARAGQPFFLYLPLASPHTPIVPTAEWQGKSGLNLYADFVMQTDWSIGQVLQALERNGLAANTLVVLTSDNGCSPQADFKELAARGHHPSYRFRGHKADIYDGGHRIPFIVRWPGKVKPGSVSDQIICLNDLLATCADILGVKLPDDAGEDSVSILPALLGTAKGPLREAVVHHSANGSFAIRQGNWKLALCPGSGGWSFPRPGRDDASKLPPVQLYDLANDIGETNNVQDQHPEVVARLTQLLEKYVADGRSTPGRPQRNAVPVDIRAAGREAQKPPAAKVKPAPEAASLPKQPGLVLAEFIYEKAPFPSCHASTIVESKGGLVAAWFGGTREGHPDVGVWVSRHDGRGWSEPVEAANGIESAEKRYPCWNPVLFQPKAGPLLLFYKVGPNPRGWWGMLITSDDGGKTWSKPRRLPDNIWGPIKNKPVQLADGSLLCGSSSETTGWQVHMQTTPDLGKTWQSVGPLNDGRQIGAIQPAILVHKDGRLQALCRSRQGRIAEIWSADNGKTWSPMTLTSLPNPSSGIDAVTLKDGRHLLVYNHTQKGRSPLNVAVSKDGKVWQAALVLENEPGEYSYPAVIQTADGMVHVTYTWRRQRIKHVVIDPAKLTLRDLVDGNWPAEK